MKKMKKSKKAKVTAKAQKAKDALKKIGKDLLKLFGKSGQRWANGSLAYEGPRGGRSTGTYHTISPLDELAGSWCLMGGLQKLDLNDALVFDVINDNELIVRLEEEWDKEKVDYVKVEKTFDGVEAFNDNDDWKPVKAFLTQLAKWGEVREKIVSKSA